MVDIQIEILSDAKGGQRAIRSATSATSAIAVVAVPFNFLF